jgi:two-component system chemotaxis response regulator CheY
MGNMEHIYEAIAEMTMIMNGIDAIKGLKKIDRLAKIIVISAMGNMEHIYEAIAAGACGFIVKPFKEEDVVKNLIKL